MNNRLLLPLLFAVTAGLAACRPIEIGLETPAGPGAQPTAAPTEPAAAPTGTAEPEPTQADAGVLPAPLYFLAQSDYQIWRVERNGNSVTQITRERSPVLEFDVSPVDGAIAFVTENTLVQVDADGGNRVVLVIGPALANDEADTLTREIHAPRWSPDGRTIAYGLNGANLIAAGGGEPQLLQASDPVPQVRQLARFYMPFAWSPDGSRLLLAVRFWQEGLAYAVKNLSDGALVEINECCEPVWSHDGQFVYGSGDAAEGYNQPGLWRARADTGQAEWLIVGRSETSVEVTLIKAPFMTSDGRLHYLMAVESPNQDGVYIWPYAFRAYAAGADGASDRALLRQDSYPVWEALWARDGRGLALREIQPGVEGPAGGLFWLPGDSGPALELPMTGTNLRWGS